MIEKGRISPLQLAIFMHPTILATAALAVPSITMNTAGRDMWIVPIVSSVIGLVIIFVMCKLHDRFKGKTFIEYCELVLGTVLGRMLAAFYLFSFLYTNGIVIREYGEFIATTFLLHTPMVFVISSLMIVCAYALHQGVEVWVRTSQLLIPAALVIIIFMLIIMVPDMNAKEMFPMLEYGPMPVLRSSLVLSSWYSQYFIVSIFLPYLVKKSISAFKWLLISLLTVLLTMLCINLAVLYIFGNVNRGFNYPFLIAVRYVSLSDFIEHIESLLMAAWLVAIFIKIMVVYYAASLGTAQLLRLKDYRFMIAPIGLLMILFSLWCASDFEDLRNLLGTSVPMLSLLTQVFIPVLMLGIAAARGARAS
ncbi:GerAB/ArcD/ProY family transporter [Paenibacillus sacheonensis]|uniref:Endospore germination permease n=1 Tax=Paenibacillus sacheonensis TaxID=742054 RepID=A0A7X4YU45_9BACL|nr:endospore germination permease [Paenibacillus sacheonensis]MBM7566964.1 spore germination protein KB [Paenibacillus sacheonensis]NBC71586.1 endospore germination permease [Paenibacillus sacheonensis]